jgi:uncharacterized protein (UPF0332 family)
MNIDECVSKGYLQRIGKDSGLIKKEFDESEYDLKRAKKALDDNDFKWAIVKSYYSMFHSARAVLFSMGLRERRHFAVEVVLESLSKEGKLEGIYLDYFAASMEARENADYRYKYRKETAEEMIEYAEKFLETMKKLAA